MNRKLNLTLLVASSMLIALTGCTFMHDDMADSDIPTEQKGDVYVRLNVSMDALDGSRTVKQVASDGIAEYSPNGGENGDGEEAGQDYENVIDNVRLFFFEKPKDGKGINTVSAGDITFTRTNMVDFSVFSPSDKKTYTSKPVPMTLKRNSRYNVLAVANLSSVERAELDRTAQENPNKLTLGNLRDKIQKRAWSGDDSQGYSSFVMATADMPEEINVEKKIYSSDDPLIVKTDVERHAARVDYKRGGDFTCTDPSYKDATVTIEGAALINSLTGGTYMFKRVASEIDGTPDYLGKETPDVGINTNYVIDPWSNEKSLPESEEMKAVYSNWRYETHPDAEDWAAYVKEGATLEGKSNDGYRRIGYTMENTMSAANADKHYATGAVFKAKFKPVAGSVAAKEKGGYKEGATFFVFDNKIYASLEDLIAVPDIDLGTFDKDSKNWESKYGYVCNTVEGKADVALGNVKGKTTRELLAPFGIKVYKDATCYYTWWIRHSNDRSDETNGVMEYAIVRNNVYKLNVVDIYSIGGTVPEEGNIKVRVYVKNWKLLDSEQLEM